MNEANPPARHSNKVWLRAISDILICGAILAVAAGVIYWINQTEPVAQKADSTRKSAALVETIAVHRETHSPRLMVLGTVQAAQQLRLRPQVSGQVIDLSPEFVPGGMVEKGELLLRIDPADFENAISIRQSELAQAEASMEIEKARQRLAENELQLLEGTIDDTNRGLVLREPQIASIQAEVAAAQAEIGRARLDLERTKIYAPFDAQILSRSVNIGSQIGPGDELGQLVGLEEYWVLASVPVRSLRWVQFPERDPSAGGRQQAPSADGQMDDTAAQQSGSSTCLDEAADAASGGVTTPSRRFGSKQPSTAPSRADDTVGSDSETSRLSQDQPDAPRGGSKVYLRNPDAWGPDVYRHATVSRLIGQLDQQSRLARVLITVGDPLGRNSEAPPLILDTLLQTEIIGRPIENVVRLKREYVRDNDTVWIMKDQQLEIREVAIEFQDAQYAYIREGLENGDEVVTTTLATVAEGVRLRRIAGSPSGSGAASADSTSSGDKEPVE